MTESPEAKLQRVKDKLVTIENDIARARAILKGEQTADKIMVENHKLARGTAAILNGES